MDAQFKKQYIICMVLFSVPIILSAIVAILILKTSGDLNILSYAFAFPAYTAIRILISVICVVIGLIINKELRQGGAKKSGPVILCVIDILLAIPDVLVLICLIAFVSTGSALW